MQTKMLSKIVISMFAVWHISSYGSSASVVTNELAKVKAQAEKLKAADGSNDQKRASTHSNGVSQPVPKPVRLAGPVRVAGEDARRLAQEYHDRNYGNTPPGPWTKDLM